MIANYLRGENPMRARERRGWGVVLFLLLAACRRLAAGEVVDLLPDLVVRPSELYDHALVVSSADQRLFRFSNGTANIGTGKLHLEGVLPGNDDGTQSVVQVIQRSDGTSFEREAGLFVFHAAHNHIHVEDWCRYRLRELLPGDGVGTVVAGGEKVSFCILDLAVYDRRLPNFRPMPEFESCQSRVQGLSVGWIDVYSRSLPGQVIDVTRVPDGFYWLESEVDPEDYILETDETNNIARIKVTIGNPPRAPDRYEPNDDPDAVRVRPPARFSSPNLGPCNPKRVVTDLSIHAAGDEDHFRFYSNDTGGTRHFVRIDFDATQGDLGLALLDDDLRELGVSNGGGDLEVIPLEGLGAGWYYARVFGSRGAINPAYMLTVVPPRNEPPSVTVLGPPAGDTRRIHGADSYVVRWEHLDPEGREAWVSVFLNGQPVRDGNEIPLPAALFTEAHVGIASINSTEVPPGTYWIHCEITDGGSASGSWSPGTVTFVDLGHECAAAPGSEDDCNGNSALDRCEVDAGLAADCNSNGVPDACDVSLGGDWNGNEIPDECEKTPFHRGDVDQDGAFDLVDAFALFDILFLGAELPPCREATDANNDGRVEISDAIQLLGYLFLGSARAPAEPGPPPAPCGVDPDPIGSDRDLGCESYAGCRE
jgi:hypothetical protein